MTPPRMIEPGLVCRSGVVMHISPENQHHLLRSLRLSDGDEIIIVDQLGLSWRGILVRVEGGVAFEPAEIIEVRAGVTSGGDFCVIVPALKSDRTEWAIQKAVEVGVARMMVVSFDRSVRRFDARTIAERVQRYQRIVMDASRQCGRTDVPEVTGFIDLASAIEKISGNPPRYFLDEREGCPSLASVLVAGVGGAVLAVGPEGSFSDGEYAVLDSAGFVGVGLGPRILRAETAVVSAIIVAQTVAGDMV